MCLGRVIADRLPERCPSASARPARQQQDLPGGKMSDIETLARPLQDEQVGMAGIWPGRAVLFQSPPKPFDDFWPVTADIVDRRRNPSGHHCHIATLPPEALNTLVNAKFLHREIS